MAKKCISVLLCVLATAFLAACVLAPSASIALLPLACMLAYYLSMTFGVWIPACAAAFYALFGFLFRGFTLFTVIGAALLAVLLLPRLLRRKLSVWAETGLCAAVETVAVCACCGIFALAGHKTVTDVIADCYASFTTDPILAAVGAHRYRRITAEALGHVPLSPGAEGYYADVIQAYAKHVAQELDGNVLWYITGFGAFAGGFTCAGAAAVAESRHESTARVKFKDVRLGKNYLLIVVLPVLLFAFLAFYEPMQPVVRAVVNVAVTLPATLCGITLLYHTCARATGRARMATTVAFWVVLLVAAFFYEWGLLLLGFVGLADAILNVRRLLDWALS